MTFDWRLASVTLLAAAGCADNGNDLGFMRDGKGGENGAETGGSGLAPSTGGSDGAGENAGGTSASSFGGGTGGADTSGGAGADSGSGGGAASDSGGGTAGSSAGVAGEATGGNGGSAATGGTGGTMAGTGGAAGACAELTTLEACELRFDCYSVFSFPDPMSCVCSAEGCCARFSRCVSGVYANCDGTQVSCTIVMPYCEGDYVIAYNQGCYEGCVRTKDCEVTSLSD